MALHPFLSDSSARLTQANRALPHVLRFFKRPLFKRLFLLTGAIALSSCTEGTVQSASTIVFDEVNELFVQPIRVCDDSGVHCASVNLFEDITRKILAQAQLQVNFLPANQLNDSRFLTLDDGSDRPLSESEFYELTRGGEAGDYGRHPDSTRTSGPINIWFVDDIEGSSGFIQYGLAWVGANGIVVSDDIADFGSEGRTDTVAHEIGHNLGLTHATANGDPSNVLADGNRRNVPGSIGDITPDGAGLSRFTDEQIGTILNSPFVISADAPTTNSEVVEADLVSNTSVVRVSDLEIEPPDSALLVTQLAEPTDLFVGLTGAQLKSQSIASTPAAASIPEPSGKWLGLSLLGVVLCTTAARRSSAPTISVH